MMRGLQAARGDDLGDDDVDPELPSELSWLVERLRQARPHPSPELLRRVLEAVHDACAKR